MRSDVFVLAVRLAAKAVQALSCTGNSCPACSRQHALGSGNVTDGNIEGRRFRRPTKAFEARVKGAIRIKYRVYIHTRHINLFNMQGKGRMTGVKKRSPLESAGEEPVPARPTWRARLLHLSSSGRHPPRPNDQHHKQWSHSDTVGLPHVVQPNM